MKKSILRNKKGVTVLEGLIALGLLAMVAAGAFAVLLSSARHSSQSDFREEMLLAVEKANDALQQYAINQQSSLSADTYMTSGLCTGDSSPLSTGTHSIDCMLPALCDKNAGHSAFSYTVATRTQNVNGTIGSSHKISGFDNTLTHLGITYNITCNGYSL